MVSIVALLIWRINPVFVLFGFLVFGALDGAYLSAALTKVPDGAWFTLVLAIVLASIFILWRFGKEQQWKAEAEDRFQPSHLVRKDDDGGLYLTPVFGGGSVTSIKGLGIFFDKVGSMTPTVFIQFLSKFNAIPDVVAFFHLRPLSTPSVPIENRYTVTRTVVPNCYRLTIRHGYTDEVVTEDLVALVYDEIRKFVIREGGGAHLQKSPPLPMMIDGGSSTSSDASPQEKSDPTKGEVVAARLAELERAYSTQVVYIVGKEQMRVRGTTRIWRRVGLSAFLWLRENTRSKIASMRIPTEQLVEVGFVKEV